MPTTNFLNVDQLAGHFGVSAATIWRWKRDGDFPKAVQFGRGCTRWRESDVEAWELSRPACFAMILSGFE